MKQSILANFGVAVIVLLISGCGAAPPTAAKQSAPLRRHALLVGCSRYEHLPPSAQLQGPANDVRLMHQLLIDQFQFDPDSDDMVTLADAEDAAHQPTRKNIEREFVRLGETVQSGEQVVILMSGHGSQQPDNDPENPADAERDGLDEIFLPSDIKRWNGKMGTVENAIVDDEIRGWQSKLVDRGALVWTLMDWCHSGTGVRGGESEVLRHVPAEELVPIELLSEARAAEALDQHAPPSNTSTSPLVDGGGFAAIYAAQPHETTPERKLPSGASPDSRKYYGLLTFTICDILTNTSGSLTYKELAQAVQTRYVTMGRRSPNPFVEGPMGDRLVLGNEKLEHRSNWILEEGPASGFTVDAGALHGITVGSILAVYPSATDASSKMQPLGYVRVTRTELARSDVRPCEYRDTPRNDSLPKRGRCEIAYQAFDTSALKVAVDSRDLQGREIPVETITKLTAELKQIESRTVAVAEARDEASWLIRLDDDAIHLVPETGIARADGSGQQQRLVPIRYDESWNHQAIERLEQISRATKLLRLASGGATSAAVESLGLEIELYDKTNDCPLRWQSEPVELRNKHKVRVSVRNTGKKSLDVTMLYVDSAYGIDALYPKVGEPNRLTDQEPKQIPLKINTTTVGLENLVVIAVERTGPAVNFRFLAQPSLAVTRSGESLSPLAELCHTSMYGVGNTRGVDRTDLDRYEIKVITWKVKP